MFVMDDVNASQLITIAPNPLIERKESERHLPKKKIKKRNSIKHAETSYPRNS